MASNEKTALQVVAADLKVEAFRKAYDATLPTTLRRLMPLDRAVNILLRSMQKNPKLAGCDPNTLKQSLLDSAALGLELNGPLHHAYAVPYYNGRKGVSEAQLQIGFQGLLELARRTGEIDGAPIVQWVYAQDDFEIDFANHKTPIVHKPYLDGPRGDPKLVYCLTWFKSGGYHFDFMSHSDIIEHRNKFSKKDRDGRFSDAWEDNLLEMGRKTIIRRAAKHWPLSSELAQALEVDEASERGDRVSVVELAGVTDVIDAEVKPASRTEELAEKLAPKTAAPAPHPEPEIEKKVQVQDKTSGAPTSWADVAHHRALQLGAIGDGETGDHEWLNICRGVLDLPRLRTTANLSQAQAEAVMRHLNKTYTPPDEPVEQPEPGAEG